MPRHQRELGLKVRQSNLCSEIMLHSGLDHLGVERTAVCCLSSVNAEMFLDWRDHPTFVEDVMRFLDNVLQDFIDRAPSEMAAAPTPRCANAPWPGFDGLSLLLQGQNVPFESALANPGTCGCSSTCAGLATRPARCWRPSVVPVQTPPSEA